MNIFDMEKVKQELPENIRVLVDPTGSREKKNMIARGGIPLMPRDMVIVLFLLLFDTDDEVKVNARNSFHDIPEDIMLNVLSDRSLPPEVIDYIARNHHNEGYNQAIILNPATYDSTIAYLAERERSQQNIEIIANNKERILRSPQIVEALSSNPAVSRSTLDEVISFLSLHLEKTGEGKTDRDSISESASDREFPPDHVSQSFLDDVEVEDTLVDEHSSGEISNERIYAKISSLSVPEKLKLALQGNTEARRILIRDHNRVVSQAVLRNPRLTDTEIIQISQSKVVDEEVLREIARNKEWTRLYQVKLSLVSNPKTPPHISLNLLRHIRERDLRRLVADRNIPRVVTTSARSIIEGKKR